VRWTCSPPNRRRPDSRCSPWTPYRHPHIGGSTKGEEVACIAERWEYLKERYRHQCRYMPSLSPEQYALGPYIALAQGLGIASYIATATRAPFG